MLGTSRKLFIPKDTTIAWHPGQDAPITYPIKARVVRKKRTKVSDERFIAAWVSSKNQKGVADKLGISQPSVTHRVHSLRDIGVKLPAHDGLTDDQRRAKYLNALIKRLTKEK